MKKFLLIVIGLLIFSSCSTRKEIVYFQDIERIQNFDSLRKFEPRIEINDVLSINVSSMNDEVVEPFRMDMGGQSGNRGGSSGSNNASMYGYLVDTEGNIQFPVLGEISVINQTRGQLEDYLTRRLREYVTDAVVRVRIINFKITVLGETGSSVIDVPDERISVPQAIAMAGDITYDGKRDNILVIRDHNGKLTYGRVDLTSADIFKNPYYYLKQNDIVYIEPTYRKVKSAGFITSWQGIVSIVTTAFSLIVLFTR
ncbi:polysaccharide export outer membrane protein [Salinimicrobium catena]|uniref:Polysaccharide export outer membrane protein n=1 Tax=Salinimicrobium catena TaxID=390640 RepID=A0A1H5LLV3_9FLAO|nr:polysaccharide biosynthesis/export family protein [Salinimicrobium catena]SDL11535.1 polysaccharide export outer membrane protein [Salinimicrobium catena]SEE77980.1 polysaccharide export outer membrane protein [Salinimicrobium catena]